MMLHYEIFSRKQRNVLESLSPLVSKGAFYLAGGTALALQLGHRKSVDLDWFCSSPLRDPQILIDKLKKSRTVFSTSRVARGTLYLNVNAVKVSFLEYRYPLLRPLVADDDLKCNLASLDDLVCMKLAAIADRGAKRFC